MTRWLKLVLTYFMRDFATGRAITAVKRRGLRAYFRAVNGVRRLLIVFVTLTVLLNLMVVALFGAIATAGWIWIEDERTRLFVLFGVFAASFVIPLLAGCFLLSEKFWLRLSGAGALIENDSSR